MAYIKICGITEEKEIEYLNEAMPDFAGFVLFYPKSKRNITIEQAVHLLQALSADIKSVAVTVKPSSEQIREIEAAGFDYIQIHGEISEEIFDGIRIPVLKAFNVSDMSSFDRYSRKDHVAGYVFDAGVPGSGQTFDWELVNSLNMKNNLSEEGRKIALIAGGIHCDNAVEALRRTRLSGVDTSSGVENDNGVGKSKEKIDLLIKSVRESGI